MKLFSSSDLCSDGLNIFKRSKFKTVVFSFSSPFSSCTLDGSTTVSKIDLQTLCCWCLQHVYPFQHCQVFSSFYLFKSFWEAQGKKRIIGTKCWRSTDVIDVLLFLSSLVAPKKCFVEFNEPNFVIWKRGKFLNNKIWGNFLGKMEEAEKSGEEKFFVSNDSTSI